MSEESDIGPRVQSGEVQDHQVVRLLPCPFCGGSVKLEEPLSSRGKGLWWGVICRNTINLGGTCAIQQFPSATKEAAISRWNMRDGKPNVHSEPNGASDDSAK